MNITVESFKRAESFIKQHARPLEKTLFDYHFKKGNPESVVSELEKFRNADGGFGNSLEPDYRAPGSSAVAAVCAIHIIRQLGLSPAHPSIRRTADYLAGMYDSAKKTWPIIPASGDSFPHAPWWNFDGISERFGEFVLNPAPVCAAFLFEYAPDCSFAEDLLNHIISIAASSKELSGDAFSNLTEVLESKALASSMRTVLTESLIRILPSVVEMKEEGWRKYCLKPFWAAPSPESPLSEVMPDAVEQNLDYEIARQSQDGSWAPHWNWGGMFHEVWPQAEREWKGVITLKTLLALRSYKKTG